MKHVQHIRRSQFVLTYGPGAIIESNYGPRLIPAIKYGLNAVDLSSPARLREYEITDARLRIAIKKRTGTNSRIFSLPTNADLGESDSKGIYSTSIFPSWKICYERKDNHPVLYHAEECPLCYRSGGSHVRFVAACINGHLDEVDWNYAVHNGQECEAKRASSYFYWRTGGSSLSDIIIKCPSCDCRTDMGAIYNLDFDCSGRFPEREPPSTFNASIGRLGRSRCNRKMKVLQRQSSSLRIPETITLLTIPEYDNSISNIIQKNYQSLNPIVTSPFSPCDAKISAEQFIEWIKTTRDVPEGAILEIENYIKINGIFKFCELFKHLHDENKDFLDFIYEEFESLLAGPRTSEDRNFSMSSPVQIRSGFNGFIPDLDIYPINKIRTITAQTGYTRMPYLTIKEKVDPKRVFIHTRFYDNNSWYPGFSSLGEAIFITFTGKRGPNLVKTEAYDEWEKYKTQFADEKSDWGGMRFEPLFIWLHTFSHSLIETLSLHAGYSSSSLRERVYIDRNAENGGILVYTTSPGEDGSMGGLVETIDIFDDILDMAIDRINFCSNDPLCSEVRKKRENKNGASCYSCLLISETSCEHRNMWLDRHIILKD
jgi:hypothetical protein